MCYNYENAHPELFYEVVEQLGFTLSKKLDYKYASEPRPTDQIQTLLLKGKDLELIHTTWGIKFNPKSPLIFNSRIETINNKAFWKKLFKENRALLPMTGFYEWTGEKGHKVKRKIVLSDEKFFVVPALYHVENENLYTSLVTVPSNEFMTDIHYRMPAILKPKEAFKLMQASIDEAIRMCEPYKGEMKIVDVGR